MGKILISLILGASLNAWAIDLDLSNVQPGDEIQASTFSGDAQKIEDQFEEVSYNNLPSGITGSTSNIHITNLEINGQRVGKTYSLAFRINYSSTAKSNGSFLPVNIPVSEISFLNGKTVAFAGGSFVCNVNGNDNRMQAGWISASAGNIDLVFNGFDVTATGRVCFGSAVLKVQ